MSTTTPRANDERPPPGRPRDPQVAQTILRATVDLLREISYQQITIEGVARRAHVGKSTIYRWWGNKGLLVYEAVFTRAETVPLPDTGSFAADLHTLLARLASEFATPEASNAIPGLLADFGSDPQLREQIRSWFVLPTRTRLAPLFERDAASGDVAQDAPLDLVLDTLAGAIFYRVVVTGEAFTLADVDSLVQLTVKGLRP